MKILEEKENISQKYHFVGVTKMVFPIHKLANIYGFKLVKEQ